jgi:Ca-activated chloride channel family protein
MVMRVLALVLALCAPSARACELALVLAVDVSGSVDQREYSIQMGGLAAALRDGIVVDALIEQEAMLTVIQWTGSSRQRQTIPWMQLRSDQDVAAFAALVDENRRVWRNYSTAIGEALGVAIDAFDAVPQCRRKVIDVSGDGVSNEGEEPRIHHPRLRDQGIVVNALAIETDDADLTAYFYENLIIGEGAFVITANGFEDYPEQIRRKLQRETTRQLSAAPQATVPLR